MCADFDAMLRWRRLGISAEEVREFCVAQRPHARAELAGRPCGRYNPALKKHRTVCFLAFDGHCYMARGARALPGRGEADPAAHPRGTQSGLSSKALGSTSSSQGSWKLTLLRPLMRWRRSVSTLVLEFL